MYYLYFVGILYLSQKMFLIQKLSCIPITFTVKRFNFRQGSCNNRPETWQINVAFSTAYYPHNMSLSLNTFKCHLGRQSWTLSCQVCATLRQSQLATLLLVSTLDQTVSFYCSCILLYVTVKVGAPQPVEFDMIQAAVCHCSYLCISFVSSVLCSDRAIFPLMMHHRKSHSSIQITQAKSLTLNTIAYASIYINITVGCKFMGVETLRLDVLF